MLLGGLLIIWVLGTALVVSADNNVHTFQIPSDHKQYVWETYNYTQQRIDHFSFTNSETFNQTYLISKKHWDKGSGPIFFYTGNEGNIESFAENTGLMWDLAPKFKAMLVFAEHRYYGKSIPFNNSALKPNPELNGYLTSEQALADYAELVTYLKATIDGAANSPVIAFGGSYGGMLAAWFRIKFPHICDGAIAASAPVAQFAPTPCDAFNRIVTSDYTAVDANCSATIRKSWKALDNLAGSAEGLKWISDTFKLCKPLKKKEELKELKEYLSDVWVNMAMMDYPYETSFLKPLPGYPVRASCDRLANALNPPTTVKPPVTANSTNSNSTTAASTAAAASTTTAPSAKAKGAATTQAPKTREAGKKEKPKTDPLGPDKEILIQVEAAASLYYNYTGKTKCLDIEDSDDIGADMWDYQACTEMVFPVCTDGINDMFEAKPWDLTKYKAECMKKWQVEPRQNQADVMYGQKRLSGASNIVFSNGLLDPWSSGGILKNINKSVVALIIPLGAHHLDLRGASIHDPQQVNITRQLEAKHIAIWIEEARSVYNVTDNRSGPDLRDLIRVFAASTNEL